MAGSEYSDRPRRVQLSRKKGWRMPPNTVSVARPQRHGNPFRIGDFGIPDARAAVERFREWREGRVVGPALPPLNMIRGKNLACWCPLCDAHKDGKPFGVECADCSPCHSDVLGELANSANGCGGNHVGTIHKHDQPCHADVLLELANQDTDA